MQLILNENTYEISNNASAIEHIQEQINEFLKQSGLYFSHMVIDGANVYSEFEEYILDRLHDINSIKVAFLTAKELEAEVLLSAEQYLQRVNPELKNLSLLFFNKPIEETWLRFVQLLEGLQWIHEVLVKFNRTDFAEMNDRLQAFLPEIHEALDQKDNIAISDIIEYEIAPFMNDLLLLIKSSVDEEVCRHDLN